MGLVWALASRGGLCGPRPSRSGVQTDHTVRSCSTSLISESRSRRSRSCELGSSLFRPCFGREKCITSTPQTAVDLWTRTGPRRSAEAGSHARPRAWRTAGRRRGEYLTISVEQKNAQSRDRATRSRVGSLDAPRFSCIYIIVTAPWGGAAAPWSHRARATLDARRPSGAGRARPRGAAHDSGYCMGYCSHPIEGRDRGNRPCQQQD